jgi:hypothetical protein
VRHPLLPVFDPLSRDSMSRLVVRPSASADRVSQRAGLVRFRLFGAHGHADDRAQETLDLAESGGLLPGFGEAGSPAPPAPVSRRRALHWPRDTLTDKHECAP